MSSSKPTFRQILPKPTAPPIDSTKDQPAKRRKIASACDSQSTKHPLEGLTE
jgi:hypothetical protein